MSMTRRGLLAGAAALVASTAAAQAKRIRLLLNTSLSGPVSFFLLAEDRGYLKEAGLQVSFSTGGGAAVIVPQVQEGAYDAGYGDITALIDRIARGPVDTGPVAVWTTFNRTPFTIAVDARGPIRTAADLAGRRLIGHAVDAALVTFDMFAEAAGLDRASVTIERSGSSMGGQVADMLAGWGAEGVFGFVNTIVAAVAPLGIRPQDLRFVDYADHLPEMYGNTLFVTRELHRDHPDVVRGMVRAFNRGLADTARDPDTAIDALQKRARTNREVDRTRLLGTLRSEMSHPEGARIGIGDMDDQRLGRLIDRVVRVRGLPRRPTVAEVFDRRFLPPSAERIRSLARR